MIIACPACATRYVVPDSAIGVEGRTVRCAKCRHSWFQDNTPLDLPDETPVENPPSPTETQVEPEPEIATEPSIEERPDSVVETASARPSIDVRPEVDDVEPPLARSVPPPPPVMDAYQDEHSHFDSEPPFRARRNPLKLWTAAAAVFAFIALGTIAAVSYWGLPDWVPVSRPTFAAQQPDLVLDFPGDKQDRRTLPNGTEFFGASGTVTNVGREAHALPPILIVLRDGRERIVYEWEVAPPQASLAPGESVTINEAVTDVPRSAKFADIGWKPQ